MITCRGVTREVVERELVERAREVDRELVSLETAVGSIAADDLGLLSTDASTPLFREGRFYDRLRSMAALVGWADPRVRDRIERFGRTRSRVVRELAAEIDAAFAQLGEGPIQLARRPLAVRVLGRACAADDRRAFRRLARLETKGCIVVLEVTNTGVERLVFGGANDPLERVEVIDREGHVDYLPTLWNDHQDLLFLGKPLEPGTSRRIRIAAKSEGMRTPLLLRLFKLARPPGSENELIAVP